MDQAEGASERDRHARTFDEGGQEVKAFVASALSANTSVAITTTKPDKYDRYLADLFYLPGKGAAEDALRNGRFLNGELLKKGYAKRFVIRKESIK